MAHVDHAGCRPAISLSIVSPPLKQDLPDYLRRGLRVVFVGVNPGRTSGARGHHYAGPSNRFWKTLHGAGFTPHRFCPDDDARVVELGIGLTNICPRTTVRASDLTTLELREGAVALQHKLMKYRPKCVAFVGLTAYRIAFERPHATVGPAELVAGTAAWVLPNPSGLNAHYPQHALTATFSVLRMALFEGS